MLQKLISLPGNFSSSTVFIIPGRFITSQIIYSNKCTKNSVFIFLIHFHGGGFNFHHLNAKFYTGETISIDCLYYILVENCERKNRVHNQRPLQSIFTDIKVILLVDTFNFNCHNRHLFDIQIAKPSLTVMFDRILFQLQDGQVASKL